MSSTRFSACSLPILITVSLSSVLAAQDPAVLRSGDEPGQPLPALAAEPGRDAPTATVTPANRNPGVNLWQVPIHTQPADPAGGEYGWWASGATFKASFHDGFVFYPLLGPDYPENLPLRWSTESVRIGEQDLMTPGRPPTHVRSDWRYEYRHGAVTELYDVRADGVEQMFVVHQRPRANGDLYITGVVATALRSKEAGIAAAHRKLTFVDARGHELIEYGAATAIDASGRRAEVATEFDGSRVRLTLGAAWLADAAYPVTVDPLTARVTISTWGGTTFGLSSYPEVARDDENNQLMVFYARQFSATDFDGYARLTDDSFVNVATGPIYTDVTTSWSTGRAGACFVGGANRWVLCLERDFPAPSNTVRVRAYLHDAANTTPGSGTTIFHDIAGETARVPSVGGTAGFSSGVEALVVYKGDVTATKSDTSNSQIWAVPVDASAINFGTRFAVDTYAGDDDCDLPDVNQVTDGGSASWIVAYQRYDNTIPGDDWDVQCARVTTAHTIAGNFFMGSSSGSPTHKLAPQVAGRGGRYVCSMIRSDTVGTFGADIIAERFDWSESASTPNKFGYRRIASGGTADYVNGGLAYDSNTRSHWCAVYQRGGYAAGDTFALRLGYTAGVVESATLYNGPNGAYSPNVTFDDDNNEFDIVYGSTDNPPSGYPVYGQKLQYSPSAINVLYGTGCGSGTISALTPNAGYEFFEFRMGGRPDGTPAILWLSLGSAAIPLNPFGMPGCFFNVNPTGGAFITSIATSVAGGLARLPLPLPDAPVFIGNLYTMWAFLQPGLNPAGIGTTQGLRTQIR
ncbi:MAG: hypothetical protein R3F56_10205 [Planctomycetota bacterium]